MWNLCVFRTTGNDWKLDLGSLTCTTDFCAWQLDTKTRLALMSLDKHWLEWMKKVPNPVLTYTQIPTSCSHRCRLMTDLSLSVSLSLSLSLPPQKKKKKVVGTESQASQPSNCFWSACICSFFLSLSLYLSIYHGVRGRCWPWPRPTRYIVSL